MRTTRSNTVVDKAPIILFLLASTAALGHAASPTISSLSVTSGPVGTAVTIAGTKLLSYAGNEQRYL